MVYIWGGGGYSLTTPFFVLFTRVQTYNLPVGLYYHWYGVLGLLLGGCEGWKQQKMGTCAWTRCPWILDLTHIAQDMALFLVLGLFDRKCAHYGPFLAMFGPFLGHIVERATKGFLSRGNQGAHEVYAPFLFVWSF